ncbi:MAG: hypothetical protein ACRDXX_04235, partial [Stackebrandtia sp.]
AVDLVNDITAFSDKFGRSIELHDEIDRFTNNDKYGEGSAHRIQAQADKHNGGGRFDPRFTLGIPKNVINEAYRILCARMKYLSIAWQAAVDTTAEVELLPEGGNKAAEIGQSETDPVVEQSWSTASGAGAHGAGGGGAGGGSGGGAGASGSASTGGASAVPALDLENAADPTGDQGGPLPKELLEIDGSDEFAESVRAELDSIALTPQGRELLDELTVRLDAVPEHEGGPALLEFAESTDGDASHSLLDDADGKCLVVRIPADELGGPASESELEFQLREALNLLEPAKEEV